MLRALKETRFIKILSSFKGKLQNKMSAEVETLVEPVSTLHATKRPATENEDSGILAKQQKIEEFTKVKKRNYAVLLAYLGKDYFGMQRNPGMKTIEEDLITALFKAHLIGQEAFDTIQTIHFQRAARTDKGVSATRQIVSLKMPEGATKDIINEYLPDTIRVFGLKRVTKGFNSKIQCTARSYTYTLPSYAFAPDDPNILRPRNGWLEEMVLEEREKSLSMIDGKPYTDYRLSPEIRERVSNVLKLFEGTHNYHNFTAKVRPLDPRANRYIMEFKCSEPWVSQGMEFVTLEIKGQSFMLHQIRKMVALAIGIVRNLVTEETLEEAFKPEKMDIPIVPSLGLVLNHVHYDHYNRRYGGDGMHETLEWTECDDDIMQFHKKYILRHIEDTEVNEKSMLMWLASLALHTYGTRDQHISESPQV
ncbi:tRNA pseudouridine synthase A [Venturia canescens]|uniref:tRNA pseudouridine synthase A n=1 Tax=Venturia canescens TaxID=32260 RepID=UPI001C9CAA03|nr:tRNA pseudouridine synthase A [Venturia canescens]